MSKSFCKIDVPSEIRAPPSCRRRLFFLLGYMPGKGLQWKLRFLRGVCQVGQTYLNYAPAEKFEGNLGTVVNGTR